jgi:hypothetical protein
VLLNSPDSCRFYIRLTAERVHQAGVGQSAEAFIAFAAKAVPQGTFDDANSAGPLGFFPNPCT